LLTGGVGEAGARARKEQKFFASFFQKRSASRINVSPMVAYFFAFLVSSVFFLIWNFIELCFDHQYDAVFSTTDKLGFAVVVYIGTGFLPGLIVLSLPLSIAVRFYRNNPAYGVLYFPLVCSLALFFGCSVLYARAIQTFSLAPPFFECLVSAVQKQGACFICSGLVCGLTYRCFTKLPEGK
jgi:hypothetical protein